MKSLSVSILGSRDFRLLLAARLFGAMALQSQAVILGWQVYSITKDPFMLGLTGLFEAVPALICALFAGHIVDISRPHRVYITCVGALSLNMLGLLLIGGGFITLPGGVLPYLYAGAFISGVGRSFIMPASFTLLSQIVPKSNIAAASAWLSSGFQMAAISGPAIAGIIYGGYGARVAWLIPAGLIAANLLMISAIHTSHREYRNQHTREPAVKSIKAGWKFILSSPVLLSVMALDMFAVLFGGAVAMLPAYADQVLHVGSEGLGMLRASPAIGAIVTALILALMPMKRIRATVLLAAIAGFGLCIIGFGLSHAFWLSIVFLVLSGAFDSISMVIRGTLMQLLTPDSMRGRVSAVNSMFIISSNEIGAFESGLAAHLLGLMPSVVFGGICTLTVVAATALISPKLRRTIVHTDEHNRASA